MRKKKYHIVLNMPGIHNVLNALAAFTVGINENVKPEVLVEGFRKFRGVERRFQVYDNLPIKAGGEILLIDDYGHHPTEINATIKAIRHGWPHKRLVMIFQPHRYSRTKDLYEDFVQTLSQVDLLLLMEVYSAGETYIFGADSENLCNSIYQYGKIKPIFVSNDTSILILLHNILRNNDILLMQGAGNIGTTCKGISQKNTDTVYC